jgi:hypothetical protein
VFDKMRRLVFYAFLPLSNIVSECLFAKTGDVQIADSIVDIPPMPHRELRVSKSFVFPLNEVKDDISRMLYTPIRFWPSGMCC